MRSLLPALILFALHLPALTWAARPDDVPPPARAVPAPEISVCAPHYRAVVVADDPALARRFAAEVATRLKPLCSAYGQPVVFDSPQRFLESQLTAQQQALLTSGQVRIYVEQGRP